jgi:hypothetical protein
VHSPKKPTYPALRHYPGWFVLVLCSVALLAPPSNGAPFFNDWAATNLNTVPAQSGPTNDPDSDGAANLAEFAFGTDPLVGTGLGNAITTIFGGTSGFFGVELFEQAGHVPGVQIDVDATVDMVHWIRPWWLRTLTNSLPGDPTGSVREVLTTYLPGTNIFIVRGDVTLFQAGPETATYYVAPNGNDSAAGTSTNAPFRSVAKAVSVSSPGNLIYVRGGTYTTNATISISASHNGTAANPIRLRAYPGESPILNFGSQSFNSNNRGINFSASWWQVYGLEIENAGDNGMNLSGNSNVIERCVFHNNSDTGLQISGTATSNLVLNCDSYRNFDAPNQGENADGFAAKSFPENGVTSIIGANNVFRGCRSWENADDGWDLWQTTNKVVIDTCWSFANGTNFTNGGNSRGDGNGFKLGGHDTKNAPTNFPGPHLVMHCASFKNIHQGFDQNNNATGITLDQNTAWSNGGNNFQMNHVNTNIVVTIHTVRNNISVGGGIADVFFPGSILISNSWQVITSPAANTNDFLSVDISMATAARRDDGSLPELPLQRPVPNGRLVDKGANIGQPFSGSAPDLGAFEAPSWP